MTLAFTIFGKPCSNNIVTRRVGNTSVKSLPARIYQARVASCAQGAAMALQWVFPATCSVSIRAWNVRLDIDNISKTVLDGMAGTVYANDNCVRYLAIEKAKDTGEQRLDIEVTA